MTILSTRTVLVTTAELREFADTWPCSGLRYTSACVSFEFATNGDLVDVSWYSVDGMDIAEPDGVDGPALLALSQDAQAFLNSKERA